MFQFRQPPCSPPASNCHVASPLTLRQLDVQRSGFQICKTTNNHHQRQSVRHRSTHVHTRYNTRNHGSRGTIASLPTFVMRFAYRLCFHTRFAFFHRCFCTREGECSWGCPALRGCKSKASPLAQRMTVRQLSRRPCSGRHLKVDSHMSRCLYCSCRSCHTSTPLLIHSP